jgi:hypothetical protein
VFGIGLRIADPFVVVLAGTHRLSWLRFHSLGLGSCVPARIGPKASFFRRSDLRDVAAVQQTGAAAAVASET